MNRGKISDIYVKLPIALDFCSLKAMSEHGIELYRRHVLYIDTKVPFYHPYSLAQYQQTGRMAL
jgi:hypothetical protein